MARAILGLGSCLLLLAWCAAAPTAPPEARPRRPVAAALLKDGATLAVANQRSGSISLVDVAGARVLAEVPVGGRLTGLAVTPDRRHLLATDEERHELIAITVDGPRLTVRGRVAVGPYPASVTIQPDGRRAAVVSSWSRRLEVIDLAALKVAQTICLPFVPRDQCLLPRPGWVAVADAFAGHLAVVDVASGTLGPVHRLPGHNLRGLAVSADGRALLVAHQILDQRAPATQENLIRGTLMANVVRSVPLDALFQDGGDLDGASRVIRLGGVGAGAGDPAGVMPLADGRLAVALAGVDEVALVDGPRVQRLPVGRRPTVLVPFPRQAAVVALNTLDDALTVLDTTAGTVRATIPLGPPGLPTIQDRGERLFFDARLSRDGWMSCHSCHTDGHTNGLLADTLGDGTYGTPKRTLTLRNTGLTDPWGWNGGQKYLHDQVEQSLAQTMHATTVAHDQVIALTAFLHTLQPPPPPEPAAAAADRDQVERGRRFFEARGCVRCHIPPLTYSSHGTHDVGFADEKGLRQFNPPALRGVGQGYGFLHDNRAATLEEVFTRFRHKVGEDLTDAELADLLRFLRSL